MNFAEAVEAMRDDPRHRVRRATWEPGVSIRVAPVAPLLGGGDELIAGWCCFLAVPAAMFEQRWSPGTADLMAVDWVLVS